MPLRDTLSNAKGEEMPDRPSPLTDPVPIQDLFVSGLADVEDLGSGCWRFTFFVHQKSIESGEDERVVVERIVMPLPAIAHAIKLTASAIGFSLIGEVKRLNQNNGEKRH